jgi:hypothetical protein
VLEPSTTFINPLVALIMPLPARFADLKRKIAESYPNFEERATLAWTEIIEQLNEVTPIIANSGPEVGSSQ